jgi:hypothetical protein
MSITIKLKTTLALLLSTLLSHRPAMAASLELPLPWQVSQRDARGHAVVSLAGTCPTDTKIIESKALLSEVGSGTSTDWIAIAQDNDIISGRFKGSMKLAAGGWYTLKVRFRKAEDAPIILGEVSVDHIGVGEVFFVAGQSNSANHGEERQKPKTGLVSAFDGKNWQPANDPQPGASGNGGSFMPVFGDAIARKFKVPVGIVACGVGATSVREWLPKGARFPNPPTLKGQVRQLPDGQWESKGQIFDAFTAKLKLLGPQGFRAVLWHQGESDANQADAACTLQGTLYRKYLEQLIKDSRRTIGWEAPWFVAQASYHTPGDEGSPEIRAAQKSLWDDGIALQGPDSDAIKGNLRENHGRGVHFSGDGLREHGARWSEKVTPWLERQPGTQARTLPSLRIKKM